MKIESADMIQDIYSLTPLQEGMLYHSIINNSGNYVLQKYVGFNFKLNENLFRQAIELLAARFDVLRTAVIYEKVKEPKQVVLKEQKLELNILDFSAYNEEDLNKAEEELLDGDVRRGFNLQMDSLIRFTYCNMPGEGSKLLVTIHHIIVDGWCMQIIIRTLQEYYSMLSDGIQYSELQEMVKIERKSHNEYKEYIKWIKRIDSQSAMDYWDSLLTKCESVSAINPFNKISDREGTESRKVESLLNPEVTSALKKLALENQVTFNSVLELACGLILCMYTYNKSAVFGKIVSGRNAPIKDIEQIVGLFINTIPVVTDFSDDITVKDAIKAQYKQSIESSKYDFCSLAEIQSRSIQGKDLIKFLYVFENFTKQDENSESDDDDEAMQFEYIKSQTGYDITFNASFIDDSLKLSVAYNINKYTSEEIELLLEKAIRICEVIAQNPDISVYKVAAITDTEKNRILNEFNATETEYPKDKTVVELFEEQAERTPDNIALVFENTSINYAELNARANSLAYKLRELGVKPDDFVAIIADRSIEMIAGIYGILKSGGAYVPIDPTYPEDRIRFMLEDCKPKAILKYTEESIIVPEEIPVIDLRNNEVWEGASENPEHVNKPNDLIYCIYTSGTTGKPKGVILENKSVVNHLNVMREKFYSRDVQGDTPLFTSFAFDFTVPAIFGTLLYGDKLAVMKDAQELADYSEKNVLAVLKITPSYFNGIFDSFKNHKGQVKTIVFGGETLTSETIKNVRCAFGENITIFNEYGPTEATVFTSVAEVHEGELVTIGKPISNSQIYIMNETQLCGIGAPGELCIAGEGLARGYLNNPELTEEKFVKNPYGDGKMYRSGDLARWLPDGNIEYLGRIDEQVKIRGFRIELGEIENRIREIEKIKDCAVIARTDASGEKAICAYYTSEEEVSVSEIRDRLSEALPNYMIPAYMMQIEEIPVTRNGKLDKRALPEIEATTSNEYTAPQTETQTIICEVFSNVLGVEKVGINDDFFDLGGHSLRATRLVNAIESKTGVRIDLRDVFVNTTPKQLASLVDSGIGEEYVPIPKAEEKEYYPMSSSQKRTYLIQQIEPESVVYNMMRTLTFKGDVRPDDICSALQTILDRHEILRTALLTVDGEPVQKVIENVKFDLVCCASNASDEELMSEFLKPFDLSVPPLIRAKLVDKGDYWLFILDMHHVVSDAVSINVLINEFNVLYGGGTLEPLTHQYKDYSEWMRTRDLSSQAEYWKSQFEDEIPMLDIPLDYARPQIQSYEGAAVSMLTDKETSSGIKALSKKTGSTDYMIFLAVLMVTLGKYSRQEDIVIGSPISGRTHKDTENMLGMFVNTLAMRAYPKGDKTFSCFLDEVKKLSLNAYANQEYPFEELVEAVDVRRDMSRNPIFDVMLTMHNAEKNSFTDENLDADSLANNNSIAKFDMSFDIKAGDDGFIISLEYCTALFTKDTAERILSHFNEVLKSVIADSNQKINEIEMLTEEERRRILNDFNDTAAEYPRHRTVVELLEEKAETMPERTAIKYDGTKVSFRELNERANRLGKELRSRGIGTNDFVLLIAERSGEMIEAIYGILKSGGAYVPVDANTPDERIKFILEDCGAKAAVTYGVSLTTETETEIIRYEDVKEKAPEAENPEIISGSRDLAYMIYTSGTTGQPKGVMIEHQGLVNLLGSYEKIYDMREDDAVLQFASYCFDQSVWDIFSIVWSGNAVCAIPSDYVRNPEKLSEYMEQEEITLTSLTPAYINVLEPEKFGGLRLLDSSGEAGNLETLKKWRNSGKRVINTYGPTEVTVNTSSYEVTENSEKLPIGKPISNTKVYILNGTHLCGIGVPGELCIAGDGVARGYLNRPELTAEKFVRNPFGEGKMYRSGDLARWLPDGNIEYLGRIDEQVKIRGFRIELGEIESRIREIENIKDCAVIARTDASGDKAIYAYYTSDSEVSVSEIRDRLGEALPNYMIPAYMTQIEEIPVTRNGKLDRRALPEIEARTGNEYAAPETETQKIICEIFCEILNAERVGIKDGFFELGGHSLRATRLANSIEEKTGVKIALRDIFVHATPEQLAEIVDNRAGEAYEPIPKAEEKEYYAMSSAQKRTYLIQQLEPESMAYNMPFIMKMTGEVYPEKLREALQKMIDRHEILRTAFLTVEGEPVQKILETAEAEFEYTESTESDEKLAEEYFRAFDLSRPPFVRVKLVNKGEYSLFMLDMHHIVSDGMSENIFISELTALYRGEELEPLTRQYRDYSEWMRTRDLSGQAEYWKSQFEDEIPALDMPLDYARPQIQSYEGARIISITDEKVSSEIKKLSKQTGATEYMIFLAALMVTLSKYSRQEDIVIGSPISGRTHRDTEGMLGMFVNTLAMRGRPEGNKTFEEFLNEIREISLNAYENQEYPFEELVEAVNVRRDMSRNPLFDVLMVMQNNEEANADLENIDMDRADAETEAVAKFDMTFSILPLGDIFGVSLEYCTAIYRKETAERILLHFNEVLKSVIADSNQKINEIKMLTEEERRRILNDFNDTAAEYPRDRTVVELFEEQVEKTPDNIALVFENTSLTYAELNEKANALAYKLRELEVKPDDFVAIIADKSIEMIAGIYGIIKAGGAYVSIDPTYPEDRIRFMLEDCKPKAVLKYTAESITVPDEISVIDLKNKEVWEGASENPEHINTPNDLIYCIYTSGTTGKPKGVMVEHHNVVKLVKNCDYTELNDRTVILQTGQLIFDASTFEIWGTSLNGGTLHLVNKETMLNAKTFKNYMAENNVNTLFITTALFNQFINEDKTIFNSLKHLMFGGEATSEKHVEILRNQNIGLDFKNVYGPTETTTFAAYYIIDKKVDKTPIGRPISNTQIYILNGNDLCGIGVPGELCIAGDGVARGYLNRPELTAEKFVNNPYGDGKMYRSGDLARWLPDGNIEYLGRIDEQVKIRGFRIELGEIENRIREIENIKDCAVIARTDASGDKAIYAYYTSEEEVSVSEIRDRLGEALPNYMIPAYMTQIEEIPVTRNGKLDKKSLPEIKIKSESEYIAPRNDFEKEICEIFGSVLSVDKVGLDDSFYSLGGDSIKALRIVSKLRERGYKILVSDIMRNNTIGKCLGCIKIAEDDVHYEQGEVIGIVGKTPILKFFESLKLAQPQHFNQSKFMDVTGVDDDTIKKIMTAIVVNHDMLRAVYRDNQLQILSSSESRLFDFYSFDFSGEDCSFDGINNKCTEIQASIDLENGPLVKAAVFDLKDRRLLLIAVHHLVIDSFSWRILRQDFETAYEEIISGKELTLPPKTASFIEWTRLLEEYKSSEDFDKNKEYWNNIINDASDYRFVYFKKKYEHSPETKELNYIISEQEISKLKESTGAFNTGIREMLFSSLALAVNMISGQDKLTVSVEAHGREELHKEILIDRTIGWFTTIYPIILDCCSDIKTLIVNNKEIIRGVPKNGFDYSLIDKPDIDESDFICFNYTGESDEAKREDNDNENNNSETLLPNISGNTTSEKNLLKNNIVINVSMHQGILRLNVQYNTAFYSENEINALIDKYRTALNKITEYCLNVEDSVYTASDFDSSMDNDDFENLLDLI